MTYPGHAPVFLPVDGQGCESWNVRFAIELRSIRPRLSRAQQTHFTVDLDRSRAPQNGHRFAPVKPAIESRLNRSGRLAALSCLKRSHQNGPKEARRN